LARSHLALHKYDDLGKETILCYDQTAILKNVQFSGNMVTLHRSNSARNKSTRNANGFAEQSATKGLKGT